MTVRKRIITNARYLISCGTYRGNSDLGVSPSSDTTDVAGSIAARGVLEILRVNVFGDLGKLTIITA